MWSYIYAGGIVSVMINKSHGFCFVFVLLAPPNGPTLVQNLGFVSGSLTEHRQHHYLHDRLGQGHIWFRIAISGHRKWPLTQRYKKLLYQEQQYGLPSTKHTHLSGNPPKKTIHFFGNSIDPVMVDGYSDSCLWHLGWPENDEWQVIFKSWIVMWITGTSCRWQKPTSWSSWQLYSFSYYLQGLIHPGWLAVGFQASTLNLGSRTVAMGLSMINSLDVTTETREFSQKRIQEETLKQRFKKYSEQNICGIQFRTFLR